LSLEVDGQKLQFQNGPPRSVSMTWPGPEPGLAAYGLSTRARGQVGEEYRGAWGLFRMLDAAKLQRESDTRYVAKFEAGGQAARLVVEPATIRHPFARSELRRFDCAL
jgi:type VI secretion system protein ImpL